MSLFTVAKPPQFIGTPSLNPASINATTVADQTFTVKGLTTDMAVAINWPSLSAGIVIGNVEVSAANTLKIRFYNTTASPVDIGATNVKVIAF